MRKNVYVMYAIALLQGMVFYGPIATLYRQAQGVSVFEITVIESISLVVAILLEIPWGIVADRIGYRRTMIFCSGLYFISKIVFWKAVCFGDFLLERILLSVVQSGFSGVDASILFLSCEGKDSQKAFGVYNSMGMVGLLLAAGVFSIFVQDNYSLAGFLTVISYGVAAALSFCLTEVKRKRPAQFQPEAFKVTLKKTLRNRNMILFLIAVAFLSEAHQTITVFLNQVQYERCGLRSSAIGLIYIAATILGSLGVYSSAVTRRMGTRRSLVLFCGLAVVSCLSLAFVQRAIASVAGIFALRISNTLFQPLQTEIQNRQIVTENRATALSIHSMLVNSVAVGTNLVFGALSDRSLSSAFLFGAGICAASLFLFLRWYQKTLSSNSANLS